MARASAWLALAFAAIIFAVVVWMVIGLQDYGFTTPSSVTVSLLLSFEWIALLAGAIVVLKRVRPGLRLLSAAWAFSIGLALSKPYSVDAAADTWTFNYDVSFQLVISIVGLALALLARRPNHKP